VARQVSVTNTGPSSRSTGITASEAAASGDQAAGPTGQDPVGRLFGLLTVAPVLVAVAWLLVGLPLLLAGQFTPVLTVVAALLLAGLLVFLAVRWAPGRWPATLPSAGQRSGRTPWWPLVAVLAIAVAFLAMQLAHRSQQIIVQIDPSSYMQFGAWISHHGSLPIAQDRAAFGGTSHGLIRFGSAAFYQVGYGVVPQFMAGLPMVLSAGYWVGGTAGAIMIPPLLGACGVVTFGGLAARLIGPRWAPLAALVLALSLPEQYVSRSAFSEPLAQVLFLGGLCLVIDALASDGTAARVIAGLGGLALGLTLLVRIDAVSDLLLVIPYGGMLLLARRPQAIPLLGGLAVGMLYGAVEGLALSRPYLDSISRSLKPLLAALAVVVILTAVAVAVLWNKGLPRVRSKWLLYAPGVLAVVILIGLAVRPYLNPVPRLPSGAIQTDIHSTEPQGPYWALSLHWVFWYIGVPAVLLAVVGVTLLGRRCLQGRAPTWTLPLMVFAWIIVTVLYRPEVTAFHPWASRRLVPAVLPGFILLAVWAVAWLTGWVRRRGYGRLLAGGLATVCAAAMLIPTVITAFGLGLGYVGPLRIKPVAHGLAVKTSYYGELAAVDRLCAAIPRNSSVIIMDARAIYPYTEVVRGMCGVPTGHVNASPADVQQVIRSIRQAGRQPVLLADKRWELLPYGGTVTRIIHLTTKSDRDTGTYVPTSYRADPIVLWMSVPAG
jgi:hypothetical protein